jgi:hypothetical protein
MVERRWLTRHIRKPITLPPEKAEKLYIAAEAVEELGELIHTGVGADPKTMPVTS